MAESDRVYKDTDQATDYEAVTDRDLCPDHNGEILHVLGVNVNCDGDVRPQISLHARYEQEENQAFENESGRVLETMQVDDAPGEGGSRRQHPDGINPRNEDVSIHSLDCITGSAESSCHNGTPENRDFSHHQPDNCNQRNEDLSPQRFDDSTRGNGKLSTLHIDKSLQTSQDGRRDSFDLARLVGFSELQDRRQFDSENLACLHSQKLDGEDVNLYDRGAFHEKLSRSPKAPNFKDESQALLKLMKNTVTVCPTNNLGSETIPANPDSCDMMPAKSDSCNSIASLDLQSTTSCPRAYDDVTDTGFGSLSDDVNTWQSASTARHFHDKLKKLSRSKLETVECIETQGERYCRNQSSEKGIQCGGTLSQSRFADFERVLSEVNRRHLYWKNKKAQGIDTKSDSALCCGTDRKKTLVQKANANSHSTDNMSECDIGVKGNTFYNRKDKETNESPLKRSKKGRKRNKDAYANEKDRSNQERRNEQYLQEKYVSDYSEYDNAIFAATTIASAAVDDDDDDVIDADTDTDDGSWYGMPHDADENDDFMHCFLKHTAPTQSIASSASSDSQRKTLFAFSPIFSLFQSALDVTNSCDPNVSDEDEDHHHVDYDSRRMKDYSILDNRRDKALSSYGNDDKGEPARGHLMSFIEQLGLGHEPRRDDKKSGMLSPRRQTVPSTRDVPTSRRTNTSSMSSLVSKPRPSDSFPMAKYPRSPLNSRDTGKPNKTPEVNKHTAQREPGSSVKSPLKVKFANGAVTCKQDIPRLSKADINKAVNAWDKATAKTPIKFTSPDKTKNNRTSEEENQGENNNFSPGDTLAAASAFIGEYLYELWKNECLCDVRIRVGSKSFLAHKIVLAAFSDVFCPSEPMPNPTLMVDVPNTTSSAVFQILQYLYTSEMNITDETIENILSAAMFLGVTDVVDLIKNILTHPTKDNIVLYMDIIDRMQIPLGIPENSHLFREFLQEIWDFNVYKNLPERDIRAILSDQMIKVDSETDLIVALVKWVEHDLENRQHLTPSLLKHVNFVRIEPDSLARTTNEYPHIFHNTECQAILAEVYKSFAILEVTPDPQDQLYGPPVESVGGDGGIMMHDQVMDGQSPSMRMSRQSAAGVLPESRRASAVGRASAALSRRPASVSRSGAASVATGGCQSCASQSAGGCSQCGTQSATLSRLSQGLDLHTRAGSGRTNPSCVKCGVVRGGCRCPPPMPKICQDLKAQGFLRDSGPSCSSCPTNCGSCNSCNPNGQRVSRATLAGDYCSTTNGSQCSKKFRHKDSMYVTRASTKNSFSPDMSATIMAINDQFRRASRTSKVAASPSYSNPSRTPSRIIDLSDAERPSRTGVLPLATSLSRKQFRIAEHNNTEHAVSYVPVQTTPPRSSTRTSNAMNQSIAQARASVKAETKDILARESRSQSMSPRDSSRKNTRMSTRASSVPRGSLRMSSSHRPSSVVGAMRPSMRASTGNSPVSVARQSARFSTRGSPGTVRQSSARAPSVISPSPAARQSATRVPSVISPGSTRQSFRSSTTGQSPGPVRQSFQSNPTESPSLVRQSMRGSFTAGEHARQSMQRASLQRFSASNAGASAPMGSIHMPSTTLQTIDTLDNRVSCKDGECQVSRSSRASAMSQRMDYDDHRKSRSDIPVALKNPSISY